MGILAGLILAAVFVAREAARRLDCPNRLKQLGLALYSSRAAKGTFLSALPPRFRGGGGEWSSYKDFTSNYDLLPYLENTALFNSVNLGPVPLTEMNRFAPTSSENETAYGTRVACFVCPSDSGGPRQGPGTVD